MKSRANIDAGSSVKLSEDKELLLQKIDIEDKVKLKKIKTRQMIMNYAGFCRRYGPKKYV